MAQKARPRQGEPLAVYLDRLLVERKVSVNALSRRLADADGGSKDTWERKLRRWTAGGTAAVSDENAAALGAALTADFSAFVRGAGANGVKDLLTQALERIEALEQRLGVLERP